MDPHRDHKIYENTTISARNYPSVIGSMSSPQADHHGRLPFKTHIGNLKNFNDLNVEFQSALPISPSGPFLEL